MLHRFSTHWLPIVLLCLAAAVMLSAAALAAGPGVEETYTVLGSGRSVSQMQDDGRQTAITDGLTAAVGRATQTLLSQEALRQHFGELDALVFRQARKFVSNYKVLSQTRDGLHYRVLVVATVSVRKIDQELRGLGILKSQPQNPTVLLLIAEQNIDDFAPRFWWGPNKKGNSSIAMDTMVKPLSAQGLTVLGPAQLRNRKNVDWKRFNKAELTFREAADLGLTVGADLVIVGNSLAVPSSAEVGSGMQALKGSVSAHVIDAKSAEEVAKISQTALGMHTNEVGAGVEALSNAGRIAGQALARKIVQAWQTQSKSVARIEVIVEGTKNLVNFVQFRRALSALEGVEKVQIKEMGTNAATLIVDFNGTAEALAADLGKQSFGAFGLNLLEVSATGLKLMLVAG